MGVIYAPFPYLSINIRAKESKLQPSNTEAEWVP